jgi:P27 family predicted phage terminase small subunit
MARGRKPQPAAVKEAKGNPGRRRIPKAAEEQAPDLGTVPAWLDTSAHAPKDGQEIAALAVETWRRLQPLATGMKLLKATDEWTLGRFCQYQAEWVHFTRVLAAEGYWYEKVQGNGETAKLPHPASRARRDAERSLQSLGEAMGLTPAARLRITQQLVQALPSQPGLPLDGDEAGAQKGGSRRPASREAGGSPLMGGEGQAMKPGFLN